MCSKCRSENQSKHSQISTFLAGTRPHTGAAHGNMRIWPGYNYVDRKGPGDIRFFYHIHHVQVCSCKNRSQLYDSCSCSSRESTFATPPRGNRSRETPPTKVRLLLCTSCPNPDPLVFSLQTLSTTFDKSSEALRAWASGEGEDLMVRSAAFLSSTMRPLIRAS